MTGRARPEDPLAPWCEAQVPRVCTGRATCRHHRLRRAHGGGDEVENTADLCDACHEHVHRNPAWAYVYGWLIPSWTRRHRPAPIPVQSGPPAPLYLPGHRRRRTPAHDIPDPF